MKFPASLCDDGLNIKYGNYASPTNNMFLFLIYSLCLSELRCLALEAFVIVHEHSHTNCWSLFGFFSSFSSIVSFVMLVNFSIYDLCFSVFRCFAFSTRV